MHVVGCGVASMGLFEVSRSEHRSSVAVSRSTVTGIASMSGASLGFKQTYPCASLLVIHCAEKTTLTNRRNTAANKPTNHIHKEDQIHITYTNIQVVTRQVQHDNRYKTTKSGLFFRHAVYHLMCLLRSLPSGSRSGYLLENIAALVDYNDRQYNPCNTNMSTGKDLSPLSLTVDTWLGRRSFATGWFDIGSNSSSDSTSDLPSFSLSGQLTCGTTLPSAVTLPPNSPELCHWATRYREQFQHLIHQANFLPSISPIDSPRALSLAEQISRQRLSHRLAQSFVTARRGSTYGAQKKE
jgi:hypothetical protein